MKKITFRLMMLFTLLVSGIMNAQFSQGFETGIPGTWTVINGGDANTFTATTPGTGAAHTGTNVAKLVYSAAAHDDYLVTQQFTVTAGTSDQISLWYKHRSNTFPEVFSVLLSNTGTATTDFTTVLAATVTPTTAWQQVTYNLTPYVGQTVYVAFHSTTTDQWELYLDDIVVDTAPIPCTGTPTAGTVSPALQNLCSGSTPANLVATGFSSGVTGLTFQWEESDDNGGADAWANAVGGSGATTSTYTPPAFAGTTIYYRLKVTCTNSAASSQTASVAVSPPGNPATQATALTGTPYSDSSALNWTVGNGSRRAVYISDSATFTDPVNGNAAALVANTVYAGTGQQLIYDGTGTTATVTALNPSSTYYVKVYEYLRCGAGPYDYYFNVTTGTNIYTLATLTPPANDTCAGAIALTPGGAFGDQDVAGSIMGATKTAGITPSCQASFNADVWYTVVVPASGTITIESQVGASNTMTDSVLAAFTGACGTLTQIGCDDDSGPTGPNNLMSILSLTGRTPGETLYIGLWKYDTTVLPSAATSQFTISAYDASLSNPTFDMSGFSAYPNPVKDIFNLSYSKEISSVSVHNLLGQTVMAKELHAAQSQLDLSGLSSGTYLVKVTTIDNMVKTIKIVKE
ncbi:T9SS-dependent choice-of-anchor J family protein [Flavobacterium humi]|uniref:T9SS type A sorting domain-containing protein n=1 Tax=Flavobacterium humi TaxID=2562683 RepID=A0A4Z0LAA6_9FLAO|nr:choice-of-anchor J domain-containing protein [Flavobacterium humi]TGD58199.1 T9SS type A sorting domain-containing protein [Flavobacterium humi]